MIVVTGFVCAGGERGNAEALFRSAFDPELEPPERVERLEQVIKEHRDSAWADDALWVLGEAARRRKAHERVAYYWQLLVARADELHLEEYTTGLAIYRESALPAVRYLLRMEGTVYRPATVDVITSDAADMFLYTNVEPYAPEPVLIWEALGDAYLELNRPQLAVKAYARARELLPGSGRWALGYRQRLDGRHRAAQARADARAQEARTQPAETAPPVREPDEPSSETPD